MSEEEKTVIPSGPAPRKKKPAKSTPTSGKAAPQNLDKRGRRVPMHSQVTQTVPEEARDPAFTYRWCADYNKGKIERYLAAGWEFVLDKNKQKVVRPSGEPLSLMRLPKEFAEEDRLAKRAKIIDTNTQFKEEHRPKDDDDVPEYLAKGQNLL